MKFCAVVASLQHDRKVGGSDPMAVALNGLSYTDAENLKEG